MIAVFVDGLGWIGAAILLVAYGMVSARRWEGDTAVYQICNLAGSIGLIVNTGYHGAFPSAFVNLVWMSIAGVTLFRIRRQTRAP